MMLCIAYYLRAAGIFRAQGSAQAWSRPFLHNFYSSQFRFRAIVPPTGLSQEASGPQVPYPQDAPSLPLATRLGSSDASDMRKFCLKRLSASAVGPAPPWKQLAPSDYRPITISLEDVRVRWDPRWSCILEDDLEKQRDTIWGLVLLAVSGAVADEVLFCHASDAPGQVFTLRPPGPPSSVPFQWVYVGPYAIPDSLADIPCSTMNAAGLLGRFNAVLGTDHRLETQGMQALLEDIRATTYDFGEAYGKVRPWWTEADVAVQGSRLYADIRARDAKRDDERKETIRRRQALQATTQPRRIWDLYSNRVLPLSVIPCEESDSDDDVKLPHSLWAVSHSWVADEERTQVWTSINRKQWPVPLPSAASLAHVRVELLNMGAEYVWIDVLCLRQQGRAEDEALRTEEWKTDVPTIGFVYQGEPSNRPCITYFNGLGLPLDTSPATLESSRHWFNRVWTLQESVTGWIPGGLAGFPLAGGEAFFSQVRGLVDILRKGGSTALVPGLMQRSCTTEMDRVAGLAYCMGCDSLPQYDAAAPLDTSWQLLIKTMGGVERLELFLLHFADKPFALFPSWKEFATGVPALEDKPNHAIFTAERLVLAQNDEVISDLPGQYYQIAETSAPCRISIDENKDLAIRFEGERVACRVALGEGYTGMHGVILQGVLYTLVRLHLPLAPHGRPAREDYWVVAEVVGEKKEAAEGMQSLTDVVKWGVILACAESLQSQAGWKTTRIMYVANEVALQRTQYRDQYMKAFEAMKAEGAKSIIMELST